MVEAARKYKRVVQAGTMQRSAEHFQKAVDIIKSGVTRQNRRWSIPGIIGHMEAERAWAILADSEPPSQLLIGTCGWDRRRSSPYNVNRFGVRYRAARTPALVFELPLVLGLCRRDDDRLGSSPS